MASDAVPGSVPVNLIHGGQAPKPITPQSTGGKTLPPGGNSPPPIVDNGISFSTQTGATPGQAAGVAPNPPAQPATTTSQAALPALVAQLNKYLNDSGRPDQFRVDPASRGTTIQEINPATGEVIGQFSVTEFPELARSLGVSGVLVDSLA
ncbi:MAG TPA: flagellar protein FlaG [Steroidobacteraceae bacterium]